MCTKYRKCTVLSFGSRTSPQNCHMISDRISGFPKERTSRHSFTDIYTTSGLLFTDDDIYSLSLHKIMYIHCIPHILFHSHTVYSLSHAPEHTLHLSLYTPSQYTASHHFNTVHCILTPGLTHTHCTHQQLCLHYFTPHWHRHPLSEITY